CPTNEAMLHGRECRMAILRSLDGEQGHVVNTTVVIPQERAQRVSVGICHPNPETNHGDGDGRSRHSLRSCGMTTCAASYLPLCPGGTSFAQFTSSVNAAIVAGTPNSQWP